MRNKSVGCLRCEKDAGPSISQVVILLDIVSVQSVLLDALCLQRSHSSYFWSRRTEREIRHLRTNFASSRGQSMGKVTKCVAFPIVLPLRTDYGSKPARTNYAATFFPTPKGILLSRSHERHACAIESSTVAFLFHPHHIPDRMTMIS